jgi:hypothetical protein
MATKTTEQPPNVATQAAQEVQKAGDSVAAAVVSNTVAPILVKTQGTLNLGEVFPNFEAETTQGKLTLYDYWGSNWGILFSHPYVS